MCVYTRPHAWILLFSRRAEDIICTCANKKPQTSKSAAMAGHMHRPTNQKLVLLCGDMGAADELESMQWQQGKQRTKFLPAASRPSLLAQTSVDISCTCARPGIHAPRHTVHTLSCVSHHVARRGCSRGQDGCMGARDARSRQGKCWASEQCA